MAISKKGSRKIVIEDTEFRWRATGNDGWISVVIWPVDNEASRIVGSVGYHHDWVKVSEDMSASSSQLVVTNRIIKEVIAHIGVQRILDNHGQLNIGAIEDIYKVKDAVRG